MEALAWEIGIELGLRFDTLSLRDLGLAMEGHYRREDREWHRAAWMVCYLLAPWSKTRLTPEQLLGRALTRTRTRPTED